MKATRRLMLLATTLLFFVTLPLVVQSQQTLTVAELLGKGGKKLTKEEVQNLVSGATISGTSMNNPAWRSEYTYKSDGTMTGSATRTIGRARVEKMDGRWSVRDDGQLCTERVGQATTMQLYCDHYFAMDGNYYAARAIEGATPLTERNIRR